MGRGLNAALNLLEAATAGNCSFCGNRLKRNYWVHDDYPGKNFCKKTCLNKTSTFKGSIKNDRLHNCINFSHSCAPDALWLLHNC